MHPLRTHGLIVDRTPLGLAAIGSVDLRRKLADVLVPVFDDGETVVQKRYRAVALTQHVCGPNGTKPKPVVLYVRQGDDAQGYATLALWLAEAIAPMLHVVGH